MKREIRMIKFECNIKKIICKKTKNNYIRSIVVSLTSEITKCFTQKYEVLKAINDEIQSIYIDNGIIKFTLKKTKNELFDFMSNNSKERFIITIGTDNFKPEKYSYNFNVIESVELIYD